jgi:hypothetical protein
MPDLKFKDMQIEFEKRVIELGLSYSINNDDIYTISSQTGGGNHINVRLISSLPDNKQIGGSKNGNDDQVIGIFKFKFLASGLESDIFVFAFRNPVKNQVEFLIIPIKEFWRRHVKMNLGSARRKRVEMVFWLMQDGSLFDTTNISVEAEWYFLSKSESGRMADKTELDYSEYINSWRRLIE